MKKFLALVLTLSLTAFATMTAFAAETKVDTTLDNLGRGTALAGLTVTEVDGGVNSKTSNISFYLPEGVVYNAGDKVTVTVKGSTGGDFRAWFIDVNEVTNSDQWQASLNGITSGDFEFTHTFEITGESTEFFFKAPTFDGKVDNLTIKSITISEGAAAPAEVKEEAAAPAEDVAADAAPAAEATTTAAATSVPKTGVAENAVVYLALAAVAVIGFVATKKKTVTE